MNQLTLFNSGNLWVMTKDGDPLALELFHRHYSYRQRKNPPPLFVGPGEKMVLIGSDGKSLFVWRKFIDDSGQNGVSCSVFRNESSVLSSILILAAELIAWSRWPGERLYTFVNAKAIRSTNPGACFKKAGWKACGVTKNKGLVILEKYPS